MSGEGKAAGDARTTDESGEATGRDGGSATRNHVTGPPSHDEGVAELRRLRREVHERQEVPEGPAHLDPETVAHLVVERRQPRMRSADMYANVKFWVGVMAEHGLMVVDTETPPAASREADDG